jgi:ERCC4-type nuclease
MRNSIALDDREHGLKRFFRSTTYDIAHLPVGDIWIGLQTGEDGLMPAPNGLVIERKAAADLEASILDGRYREQRARLLAMCQERQAHPVYIIEGDLDRMDARLKKPALMKHLTRLALRYHIAVFQTACLQETAELCQTLQEQWDSDPKTFQQPQSLTYVETRGTTRQENSDDPKVFAVGVLSCCRGVSVAAAQKVLEGCGGTLAGVWEADEAKLAGILCGKQKFGVARAKRLWGLLHFTNPLAGAPHSQ